MLKIVKIIAALRSVAKKTV